MSTDKTTYIIPIRIDHIDRLKNSRVTLRFLKECTNSHVVIIENGRTSHHKEWLDVLDPTRTTYIFQESKDPIFHRTKILNQALALVQTPCTVIYDTDVLVPLPNLLQAENMICDNRADFIHPFTPFDTKHVVWYVPQAVRDSEKVDFHNLPALNQDCQNHHAGVGFIVFVNTQKYKRVGGENEHFVSWGPEDSERLYRIQTMGWKYHAIPGDVYHLEHYRDINGGNSNPFMAQNDYLLAYLKKQTSQSLMSLYSHDPKTSIHPNEHYVTYQALGNNGRLGNQLFQIAFCLSLARKTGRSLILPSSWNDSLPYNVAMGGPFRCDSSLLVTPGKSVWNYQEGKNFHYTPTRLYALHGEYNWNFHGYFQSWKYFHSIQDEIRKVFRLEYHREQKLRHTYLDTSDCTYIGVHVRRGDFLNADTPCESLGIDYYTNALTCLRDRIQTLTVIDSRHRTASVSIVLCSDDPQWCIDHLQPVLTDVLNQTCDNVTFQTAKNELDIEDLFLLSYCHHLVIGNSTFAWWAAYLNVNPGAITVCQDEWFSKPTAILSSRDLIVPGWQRVSSLSQ